jgi:hypothetical protein
MLKYHARLAGFSISAVSPGGPFNVLFVEWGG